MNFGAYSGYVQVLARVCLSAIFIVGGLSFIQAETFSGISGMIGGLGFPMPALVAVLVILIKVGGGLSVLTGFKAKWGALALALFTFLTVVFVHSPSTWGDQVQFLMAMKNIAIIGGLLLIAGNGAGAMSLKCTCGKSCPMCD